MQAAHTPGLAIVLGATVLDIQVSKLIFPPPPGPLPRDGIQIMA